MRPEKNDAIIDDMKTLRDASLLILDIAIGTAGVDEMPLDARAKANAARAAKRVLRDDWRGIVDALKKGDVDSARNGLEAVGDVLRRWSTDVEGKAVDMLAGWVRE